MFWEKRMLDAEIYHLKPYLRPFIFSCGISKDCSLFLGSDAECWLDCVECHKLCVEFDSILGQKQKEKEMHFDNLSPSV